MKAYELGNAAVVVQDEMATIINNKWLVGAELEPFSTLDFQGVQRLRIDPVSACNCRCVFCMADFDATPRRNLEPAELALLLRAPNFEARHVSVGCSFEPTIGKYFNDYGSVFLEMGTDWQIMVVTNGINLDRKDLATYVKAGFDHLHVSVHSHLPDIYDKVHQTRHALTLVDANIRQVRARYPNMEIRLTNVVSRLNNINLAGYLRWGFQDLGVDKIEIYRAKMPDGPTTVKFLAQWDQEYRRSPELTDAEWAFLVEDCQAATKKEPFFGHYEESGVDFVIFDR